VNALYLQDYPGQRLTRRMDESSSRELSKVQFVCTIPGSRSFPLLAPKIGLTDDRVPIKGWVDFLNNLPVFRGRLVGGWI